MIYDDKTLANLNLEQLKKYEVETDVNCLKQVRKFINKFQ